MTRRTMIAAIGGACLMAGSCAHQSAGGSGADPFVGFFAAPGAGALELHRGDVEGTYRGTIVADFAFGVELTRHGNVATGTYAGHQPLQVEMGPDGLIVTADGERAAEPFKRYRDRKAFEDAVDREDAKALSGTGGGAFTRPTR